MNYLRRASLCLFLFLLLPLGTAQAVMWEMLNFEQVSFHFQDPDNNVEFSGLGQCVVEYGKDMNFGFLNVTAEIPGLSSGPFWIVRNLALGDETMGPPTEMISYQFPLTELGVESGMIAPEIQYGYAITPDAMSDDDGFVFAATTPRVHMAPVLQIQQEINNGTVDTRPEEKTGDYYPESYKPFSIFPGHSVNSWIGCDMPNVPLNSGTDSTDDCACAPASCANSMAWLDKQHDEIDLDDDTRKLMKQLSNLMNRAQSKGVNTDVMARAKLDFIEAHGLPIHVKIQDRFSSGDIPSSSGHSSATDSGGDAKGWPTAAWLKSESKKGEDVEMCVAYHYKDATGWHGVGGHAVVVTGTGTTGDDDWVSWKHDAKQSDASGLEERAGILSDTGDGLKVIGMGFWYTPKGTTTKVRVEAYVQGVISESFDASVTPPPPAETFSDYCDYITRTIKPGGSLDFQFPDNPDRSMDVTIYQVDRNQEPPTQRAMFRWTDNSGKQRGITNPTDKCITVKIHNDDVDGDTWFGYIPYVVQLQQFTKSVTSPEVSNFEETGGFSLGGRDGYCEFGPAVMPSMVVDYTPEVMLDLVPGVLGTPGGTYELFLNCQIPAWNKYWARLGLIVDVLEVATPGDLFVDCLSNGFTHVMPISGPGRYQVMLGSFDEAPDFMLRLEAQNGLEMTFDAIGVPTLVSYLSPVRDEETPRAVFLAANHPNPFNPVTTIRFGMPAAGHAELAIFDLQGRRIKVLFSGELDEGSYQKNWGGTDAAGRAVAAGTYVYRLEACGEVLTRKMTLVK